MSSFGPGIWNDENSAKGAPAHKGKLHTTGVNVKKIGQPKGKGYLKSRMRADDSRHVNMSDRSLSSGIRQTGGKK